MKPTILFIQAIKQARFPGTHITDLSCQTSIPRLCIWNKNFEVLGESKIYTDSNVLFWCHSYLCDSSSEFFPIDVEMENSDDEEGDVEILVARKKRKNDGDMQSLQLANIPYYPEVFSIYLLLTTIVLQTEMVFLFDFPISRQCYLPGINYRCPLRKFRVKTKTNQISVTSTIASSCFETDTTCHE
jgi:hypothetical protein